MLARISKEETCPRVSSSSSSSTTSTSAAAVSAAPATARVLVRLNWMQIQSANINTP